MSNFKTLPLIGSVVCALAIIALVVGLSAASGKSANAQPTLPEPVTAETLTKFNRELEAALRTQQTETLTEVKSQRDVLNRIEVAINDLTKQTAGQPATPPAPPQAAQAVETPPAATVEVPQIVLPGQSVQTYQQSTRFYYTTPQRRVFSRQIFRGNCANGACSN